MCALLAFSNPINVGTALAQTQTHTLQQTPANAIGNDAINESVGTYKWKVTLDKAATETVTVTCTVPSQGFGGGNGTLRPGMVSTTNRDFTQVVRTLTFAPGETEKICDFNIINDSLDEPDESATATFRKTAGPAGVAFQGNNNPVTASFTVKDDDAAPMVQFKGIPGLFSNLDRTHEGIGTYTFNVELSGASGRVGSCDFLPTTPSNQAQQCNRTAAQRDAHEVSVEFVNSTAGIINPAAEGTDYRIVKSEDNNGNRQYYAAGETKKLFFAEGETTAEIKVEIMDDNMNELDKAFSLALRNPKNLTLDSRFLFILRIQDNDYPVVTITPSEINESVGTATFMIKQTGDSSRNDMNISTCSPNTAGTSCTASYPGDTATHGVDFEADAGTSHTFTNDEIQYTVDIMDDSTDEHEETFTINLRRSSAIPAVFQEITHEVTIHADSTDAPPTVSLDIDSSVSENLSNGMAEFKAFLSEPSGKEVTVGYATENGTAIAGQDYASTQGTLTFAPGEDEKAFEIAITNDATDEDAETFAIVLLDDANLSNTTLGARPRQTVTILEDAADPPPAPTLPAPTERMGEGDTYIFNVTLGGPNERERIYDVSFGATGDTAVAGTDYVATPNLQVTVPKGETEATFEVEILEDDVKELDETFTLTLQAVGDPSQTATVVATIASKDEVLTMQLLAVDGQSAVRTAQPFRIEEGGGQGNAGVVNAIFSLALTPSGTPSGRSASFDLSVIEGTARLSEDYQDTDGIDGTSRTLVEGTPIAIEFAILDDDESEPSEHFDIVLQGTSGTTARQVFRVGINDNDGPDPILREIGRHAVARTEALIENQPRLIPMLRDSGAGDGTEFSLRLTDGGVEGAGGGFRGETLWGATTLSRSIDGNGEHEHLLATLGAHARMSERLHLGGMLQFDRTDTKPGGEAVSGGIRGAGWMAGPYFAMRGASNPLFFEGRLLYGRATNNVDALVIGAGSDPRAATIDSERWLAQARVEGTYLLDLGATLIPLADLSHARDVMEPFLDDDGDSVEGQTISLSKLQIGAELEIPLVTVRGDLRVRPGLRFVVSNSTYGAFAGEEDGEAGLRSRGRIDFGIDYRLDDNVVLGFESFYSGLGRKELESYGAGLDLQLEF